VGGLSIAFAMWRMHLVPNVLSAIAIAPFTTVLACLVWVWSCSLVVLRTRTDLVGLMRYDALAYASLGVYPVVALVRPGAATAGADLALVAYLISSCTALARFQPGFRATLIVFALSRLIVVTIVEATAALVGYRGTHEAGGHELLDVWTRWDGAHYLSIARLGYAGSNLAFFPLYPLTIRLLAFVVGSPILAGLLVSNIAFLIALALLRRLIEDMFDSALAGRTIFYISTFPTAVFFSAVYTESLFLAFSVATFTLLRRERWLAAGFAGGLAALTRVEGVLLIVPYLIEAFARRDARSRNARREAALYGAGMIVVGFLTFVLLSALVSGDPLYFLHVQGHWQRHATWPWTSLLRSVHLIVGSHDAATVAVQTTELGFFAFALTLAIVGWRRLPIAFNSYTMASLLLPLFTGSLMSGQRFTLVLFPLFVVLAAFGGRPSVHQTLLAVSLPLFGAFTVLFAGGFWIG
jgi:Gpi18-like mannosyltransferase